MPLWYRVFGLGSAPVDPTVIRDFVQGWMVPATVEFEPAGPDWLSATVGLPEREIHIERFPAEEEGIRAELNAWAAFLETCDYSANNVPLMERMIQTKQLFTLQPAQFGERYDVEQLCMDLARLLARLTDGVYLVEDVGFFEAAGQLLLPAR